MITIFTPTYNRAFCLTELYTSLINQTSNNFEWLIIDDGSTDNTNHLINEFVNHGKISVRYYFQSNGGKHRAINKGVQLALGELFFIVDSDDSLESSAIERVLFLYNTIKNDYSYAGVCGNRCDKNHLRIGGNLPYQQLTCNSLDFRVKYRIKGDMAEVFRTDILRQYPFPEYENEIFCTEALVFNRIAQNYNLLYFNENIYLCEYLEDGLSFNLDKIQKKAPIGMMIYYSEFASYKIPIINRIKAYIHFWQCASNSNLSFTDKYKLLLKKIGVIFYPLGIFFYTISKFQSKQI